MKLGEYLFTRLRQLGVGAIHGIAGDYNLDLLDHIEPSGLLWVGNSNELNAAYAADAYARIKGIGAVLTTFGVGELSAINGIAGAYVERAPVVHIVGVPSRTSHAKHLFVHHTFKDGNYERFAQMHAHVTVAQARLWDPRTSPYQIDHILAQCLHHSRPVYIEIPTDVVDAPVPDDWVLRKIHMIDATPASNLDRVLDAILDKLYAATHPIIILDGESRPMGVVKEVEQIVKSTNWPTWAMSFGKTILDDESVSNFHGVYAGDYDDPAVQTFVKDADLVLCFGPHNSSSNTFEYSSIPNPDITISFLDTEVRIANLLIRDVPAKHIVSLLAQKLDTSRVHRYEPYPSLPRDTKLPFSEVADCLDAPLCHDKVWRLLANFLQPGDIILGEAGTSSYGVCEMPLPKHSRLFGAVTWLSIGYMLPAAQGAALAQRELMASQKYHGISDARTVLFMGDGSFQMTAQELGTIIRHNLDVVFFLINNDGYTIERCIHERKQSYHDIAKWRYTQAPGFFGASESTYTASVKTWGDLVQVLGDERLCRGKGLRMVEIILDREDTPRGPLRRLMEEQKRAEPEQ
ncbi:hypothetical protein ACO1O0_008389 [Amphichorda felina]